MDEKEKDTRISDRQFFCREEWEDALIRYAECKGYRVRNVMENIGMIVVSPCRTEPMPIFMQEWIENHPKPAMNRNEFIHSLGERMLALEAALAEKEQVKVSVK